MSYPLVLSERSLKIIGEVVESKAYTTRTQEFMHELWQVQGYLYGVRFGDPDLKPLPRRYGEAIQEKVDRQTDLRDLNRTLLTCHAQLRDELGYADSGDEIAASKKLSAFAEIESWVAAVIQMLGTLLGI